MRVELLKAWVSQWRFLGFNLADVLSLSRPFLAILLMITLYLNCVWQLNLTLTLFLAITDFLDGFIARKFNLVCSKGARLDEMSDKVATTMLFGFFAYHGLLHWVFFVLFAVREIYVTCFRSGIKKAYPTMDVSAKIPGKIKTCLQFGLIAFLCLPNFFRLEVVAVLLTITTLVASYMSAIYLVAKAQINIQASEVE